MHQNAQHLWQRAVSDGGLEDQGEGCSRLPQSHSLISARITLQPTNLYPRREDVARENQGEFNKLKEKIYTFDALDASRGERGPLVMAARACGTLFARSRCPADALFIFTAEGRSGGP